MKSKSCCFIGHRKVDFDNFVFEKLKAFIFDLVKQNYKIFLFGSKSEFNDICYAIVSDLQSIYPDIVRISYTCKSEGFTLESEREKLEKVYSSVLKKQTELKGFEREREHKTKYTAGKASYVERNQAMIDDCDFCVIYYEPDYKLEKRLRSKKDLFFYQPKSGTRIAFEYLLKKKKPFINIATLKNN